MLTFGCRTLFAEKDVIRSILSSSNQHTPCAMDDIFPIDITPIPYERVAMLLNTAVLHTLTPATCCVPLFLTLSGSSCSHPACSWSVSFYPQVLLNFRRKTSVGLSFDFLLYNVLAFSCYAAFTGEFDCLAGKEAQPVVVLLALSAERCPRWLLRCCAACFWMDPRRKGTNRVVFRCADLKMERL